MSLSYNSLTHVGFDAQLQDNMISTHRKAFPEPQTQTPALWCKPLAPEPLLVSVDAQVWAHDVHLEVDAAQLGGAGGHHRAHALQERMHIFVFQPLAVPEHQLKERQLAVVTAQQLDVCKRRRSFVHHSCFSSSIAPPCTLRHIRAPANKDQLTGLSSREVGSPATQMWEHNTRVNAKLAWQRKG